MIPNSIKPRRVLRCSVLLIAVVLSGTTALGGPIHTNVAFSPHKGGNILRIQYVYSEAESSGNARHVSSSTVRAAWIYGLRANLALIVNVPFVHRQVDRFAPRLGRFEEVHDGVADLTAMLKYRFWQHDAGPMRTTRLAALFGLNIRSGDSDFSSDSYDPILGLVYSWRDGRKLFDADLRYQINTGGGRQGHDTLRYDLALSYRVHPAEYPESTANLSEWSVIAELNGRYATDGSHEIYLSPGVQCVTEQWVWEASIQIPVVQDLSGTRPETDYRAVIGLRYQW